MDMYRLTPNYGTSQQAEILNTVADVRYLAPAKLAHDETRKWMLAEAQLGWILPEPALPRRLPMIGMVRERLGCALMLIGTRLQDVHTAAPAPAISDQASTSS